MSYYTATMSKLPSGIQTYSMSLDTVKSHPQHPQTTFHCASLRPFPRASVCWPTSALASSRPRAAPVVMWLFHPGLWNSANQPKNSRVPALSQHLLAPPLSVFFNACVINNTLSEMLLWKPLLETTFKIFHVWLPFRMWWLFKMWRFSFVKKKKKIDLVVWCICQKGRYVYL